MKTPWLFTTKMYKQTHIIVNISLARFMKTLWLFTTKMFKQTHIIVNASLARFMKTPWLTFVIQIQEQVLPTGL